MRKDKMEYAPEEQWVKSPYLVYAVDDDEHQLQSFENILKTFEFKGRKIELKCFNSVKSVIKALKKETDPQNPKVAVIFLDYAMDGNKTGQEVIDFIRQKQGNTITQIIIHTAQAKKLLKDPVKFAMVNEINIFHEKGITNLDVQVNLINALRSYDLLMERSLNQKKLEIIISFLLNRIDNINGSIDSKEKKQLRVQDLFEVINNAIYKGNLQLAPDAIELLAEKDCDYIIWFFRNIDEILKNPKTNIIHANDIEEYRKKLKPIFLKWEIEETGLKTLHKALCGEKISDEADTETFIDRNTQYKVFYNHHMKIETSEKIVWLGNIPDLLYLYRILWEKKYIKNKGENHKKDFWRNCHKELPLHYSNKGESLNFDTLKNEKRRLLKQLDESEKSSIQILIDKIIDRLKDF
jgi:CheY-like chemotaxis protein